MKRDIGSFWAALPFWMSLTFLPVVGLAAWYGSWVIALVPAFGFVAFTVLDAISGLDPTNSDTDVQDKRLFWYRAITIAWLPIQLILIFGTLIWIRETDHLSTRESIYLMMSIGVLTGAVGIVYAHELMHQSNRLERWLGEALMITVFYGHFVTEHLAVHHRHVATPKDAATARYNESFYRFFVRVLFSSFRSAWRVEEERMAKKGLSVWAFDNPFWRYLGGACLMLLLAYLILGWVGVGLYCAQAFVAILQLEQINYIEHYGLVRRHLGHGKFEPVAPRHSWNASHKITNYLLINLQRHSDHHYKPARRYPLLQTYAETDAPQLPYGYPAMVLLAYNPLLWRRVMNPRVRRWRSMYYPDIVDWSDYKTGRFDQDDKNLTAKTHAA